MGFWGLGGGKTLFLGFLRVFDPSEGFLGIVLENVIYGFYSK